MKGVGRELGGVALRGDQTAEKGFGVVDRERRRLEDGAALDRFGQGGGGGLGGAAALGVEGDGGDPAVGDREGKAGDVAAGGTPGGTGEGGVGRGATARLIVEVVVEELPVHWLKGTE